MENDESKNAIVDTSDRYLELIEQGIIVPGTGHVDIESIVPIKLPAGMTSEKLLRDSRGNY